MDYITDGDGREYRVVEGTLAQNERYLYQWQDLAAEIAACEAAGLDRCCAVVQAVTDAGRKSVFVERIPNAAFPAPSEGIQRVYQWNSKADGSYAAGALVLALERPSLHFREQQVVALRLHLAEQEAALATLEKLVPEQMASLEAATFKERMTTRRQDVKTLEANMDALESLRTYVPQIKDIQLPRAALEIVAIKALGSTCQSVYVVEHKVAEILAARSIEVVACG